MTEARKHDIAARFDIAARYDDAAHIQRRCAAALMTRIETALQDRTPLARPPNILEIGCGTGFLTELLARHVPDATLCVTDIAPGMLDRLRVKHPHLSADFRVMDGEHPTPDLPGPFDLIVSSLCLQWFTDRRAGLARLCDQLAPSGSLLISTLLSGSLAEWRAACAAAETPCGVPDYPTRATLQSEWPGGGTGQWTGLSLRDPTPDAHSFLRGLHRIGASRPADNAPQASPRALKRAMNRFDSTPPTPHARERHVTYEIGIGLFTRSSA